MQNFHFHRRGFNISRRGFLRYAGFAAAAGRQAFGGKEFWNQTPASAWNPEQIHRLMTNSPWAREVNIGMAAQPGGPREGGPDSPVSDPGGVRGYGGMGGYGGGIGGGGYGRRGGGARPNPVATVRWESAQPILEATKETLPAEFAGHYVIAVAGLPIEWGMPRGRRPGDPNQEGAVRVSDLVERLRAGATLSAKGKDPEGAGVVKRSPSDEAWLFGFSKEMLPLAVTDKDIEFALSAGPMVIRSRFAPKDMIYQGRLAV